MKHCISIKPGTSYKRILNIIAEDDETAEAKELTNEVDGNGDPYQLLTVVSYYILSKETEQAVDRLPNVIVSTFNIDATAEVVNG